MAESTALLQISEMLRDLLWEKLVSADPVVREILADKSQITLDPPYALNSGKRSKSYLSVYLLSAIPNVNLETARPLGNAVQLPALALDLLYLMTPCTASAAEDQQLLPIILQTFHEVPVLQGVGANGEPQPGGPVRIVQVLQPMEELCALWSALREPWHASVCYSVGPVIVG
jgi:hypothetical protein